MDELIFVVMSSGNEKSSKDTLIMCVKMLNEQAEKEE